MLNLMFATAASTVTPHANLSRIRNEKPFFEITVTVTPLLLPETSHSMCRVRTESLTDVETLSEGGRQRREIE